MICIVALIVFGALGIFSARYRTYAKEAFRCVFRRVTLRKCDTAFDKKMKAKITGKIFKRSPKTAGFVYKNFDTISWFFTAILFISLYFSAVGLYNLVIWGTCDPVTGHCLWNPGYLPGNSVTTNATWVEFYGVECDYSLNMVPIVQQVEAQKGIEFERLEVWFNETNQRIYMSFAENIERDCDIPRETILTPVFYSTKTNKAICGQISAGELGRFIDENRA